MSKRKRIKEKKTKALSPEQLATPDQTSIGRRFVMVWDAYSLVSNVPRNLEH